MELIDQTDEKETKGQLKELADQTEQEILDRISYEYYEESHHEDNRELDDFFKEIHDILESEELSLDDKAESIIELPNKNEQILENLYEKGISTKLSEGYLKGLGLKIGFFSLTIVVGNYRLVRSSWLNHFRLEKMK